MAEGHCGVDAIAVRRYAVDVDAEEVIRVWVGVYACLPHGGCDVGVSEEAVTWRGGGLVGADWVERGYAER